MARPFPSVFFASLGLLHMFSSVDLYSFQAIALLCETLRLNEVYPG